MDAHPPFGIWLLRPTLGAAAGTSSLRQADRRRGPPSDDVSVGMPTMMLDGVNAVEDEDEEDNVAMKLHKALEDASIPRGGSCTFTTWVAKVFGLIKAVEEARDAGMEQGDTLVKAAQEELASLWRRMMKVNEFGEKPDDWRATMDICNSIYCLNDPNLWPPRRRQRQRHS